MEFSEKFALMRDLNNNLVTVAGYLTMLLENPDLKKQSPPTSYKEH